MKCFQLIYRFSMSIVWNFRKQEIEQIHKIYGNEQIKRKERRKTVE